MFKHSVRQVLIGRHAASVRWPVIPVAFNPMAPGNYITIDRTIKGKVTDDTGEKLPGGSVVVKGSKCRVPISDADGSYSVNVPDNSAWAPH